MGLQFPPAGQELLCSSVLSIYYYIPRIIFALPLIQLCFIQQYLADTCYHPSDPCFSASLQLLVQYRCRLIPEKLSATAQTNHGNTDGYTVTCSKYAQYTQQGLRQTVYVTLSLIYISVLSILAEMNRAKKLYNLSPMSL